MVRTSVDQTTAPSEMRRRRVASTSSGEQRREWAPAWFQYQRRVWVGTCMEMLTATGGPGRAGKGERVGCPYLGFDVVVVASDA